MTTKSTFGIAALAACVCAALSLLLPASSLISSTGWFVAAFVLVVGFGIAKQVARNQAESDSNEMQKTRVLPWDYAKRAISIEVHRARRRDEHITLLNFKRRTMLRVCRRKLLAGFKPVSASRTSSAMMRQRVIACSPARSRKPIPRRLESWKRSTSPIVESRRPLFHSQRTK